MWRDCSHTHTSTHTSVEVSLLTRRRSREQRRDGWKETGNALSLPVTSSVWSGLYELALPIPPFPAPPSAPPQACRLTCVFVAMIFFHTLHQSLTVCLFFKLMTNKTFMKTKTFVPKIQRIRQTRTLFCSENLVLSLLVCMCCWLLNQQSSDHLNN